MNKYIKTFLVILILFILPFAAYMFLSKGTKLRTDVIESLVIQGQLGNFQSMDERDSIIYSNRLKGKRRLITVLTANDQRTNSAENVKKIIGQAKDDFDPYVYVLSGLRKGETMAEMSQHFQWPQSNHWLISYMAENHIFPFSKEAFNLPEKYNNKDVVLLMDEIGNIRGYYDITNPTELNALVKAYPIFLSMKIHDVQQ